MTYSNLEATIFLVKKVSMEEAAGSTSNKKKRRITVEPSQQLAQRTMLGQVKVKASRLRQCSTYFDACMSERWTQSKAPSEMQFHLEVHSEVQYYKDCFSRMQVLFKPIKSVAFCIGIVNAASQIGFQGVIDVGLKYLAAAPWSAEEEKLVREFCDSHSVPLDSMVELITRLDDFPVSDEERLKKNSSFMKNLLSDYLQCGYLGLMKDSPRTHSSRDGYCSTCRQKFAQTFHMVVTRSQLGLCDTVVKHALQLLTVASHSLLSKIRENYRSVPSQEHRRSTLRMSLSIFLGLYDIALKADAAQTTAELILVDTHLSEIVSILILEEDSTVLHFVRLWTRLIYNLFQGVLEGTLFLHTSQRVALFNNWNWVLCSRFISEVDEAEVAGLTAKFLSTLPRQKQAEIWKAATIMRDHGPSTKAHETWVSYVMSGQSMWKSEKE